MLELAEALAEAVTYVPDCGIIAEAVAVATALNI